MSSDIPPSYDRMRFAVDAEHGGFRVTITLLLFGLFGLIYFVVSLFVPQLGVILTALVSGVLAYVLGSQAGRALAASKSGRDGGRCRP